MDMEVRAAAAKVEKYASSQSGDTLEMVERPGGGISFVLADGQRSGQSAKAISNMVVRKVISLLAEGVRDGAAARAASDYLYNAKKGQVQATLNILSVDLTTNTLVITRNNPAPVIVAQGEQISMLDSPSLVVGLYRDTRPVINEMPLEIGITVVMFTDGLLLSGERTGESLDVTSTLRMFLDEENPLPRIIADTLLEQAMKLDNGRPVDDISVVALRVMEKRGDEARRMTVRLPIP
ncbi:MAG: SpoIIE family protein phosphatase [Chloroflexota bacterium]